MWKNGPQCDPLPSVRRDFPIYFTGVEGREDINWLLDDIAKDGDGQPAGGKRRLIRREGFASRISKNARPHDPRSPVPQNAKKMNLRKLPTDMNKNRNVKLMQVSSQVAEKASSDGATNKQCRPAHRQSTKTTVTETYTNFADKPKPTQSQGTVVATKEAGTDGTTNVQCRSIDYDNMKTTAMKLPTDIVKLMEPTLSRVSPVVANMAHTDGTRVMQYQSDDQNSMKTTIMQMPMDYLEIPEPALPRGFLELAEEARNVIVESGQSCYTEEVQSQGAGLTRPVFVTVMEYSLPVLKKGATIAPGISTKMIPTTLSAGRRDPVDQLGLVGPQDKTEQSCPVRMQMRWEPIPRAQWAQTSQLTKFSQWLKARWASISHTAQWAQTECFPRVIQISRWLMAQWAGLSHVAQWVRTECFPRVILIGQWLMAQWVSRLY